MISKLVTIGAVGLLLAVSACRSDPRNPDDRNVQAAAEEVAR